MECVSLKPRRQIWLRKTFSHVMVRNVVSLLFYCSIVTLGISFAIPPLCFLSLVLAFRLLFILYVLNCSFLFLTFHLLFLLFFSSLLFLVYYGKWICFLFRATVKRNFKAKHTFYGAKPIYEAKKPG